MNGPEQPPRGPYLRADVWDWAEPDPATGGGVNGGAVTGDEWPPDDDEVLVRPYLVTGGRTRPLHDGLRVETVVYAAPGSLQAPLQFEARRIVELCQIPRAVADLAVALSMPLGVVRVLIGDLVVGGHVSVQAPPEVTTELLERIRERVQAL